MKRLRKSGNFFLALLFNMILNLEWTIPAWILLGCHFWFDWSIRWFWIALALWPVVILIRMMVMGWLVHLGNQPDPPKENKNPYSVGAKTKDGTDNK